MLQDLHEGRISSKLEGAEWAKQILDPHWKSLIDFCWQERQDTEIPIHQSAIPEKFAEVLRFVSYVMEAAAKYKVDE
ncbi:hypothetical protein KSX_52310 [Ktedonospora formicarum]|uniref:Adenylyltransferase AadA C-terminal domain-containing protein n=2 Tax=Ktedonospora formicarum TaxID=2778364 RepID=A0A8J3MUY6_9CHLR|nr:hypothetical protein KSX_52310 [Ktedonospora formicarum]